MTVFRTYNPEMTTPNNNAVVSLLKIREYPMPEDKTVFRTYVPEPEPEAEVETKVVKPRRGRRPKATEGAETK